MSTRVTPRSAILVAAAFLALPVGAFVAGPLGLETPLGGAEAATLGFAAPTQVVNSYGFEPSVRVDSTGVVYVAIARALPQPSWVFRSMDDGASWQKLPSPPLARGAEPEIALAADDTLYFSDLYVGNVVLAWYSDHGARMEGWTLVGEASTGLDRQWITVGQKSALTGGHEMWINTNDVYRGVMQYYTPDAKQAPASKPSPIVFLGGPSVPPVYDPVNRLTYTIYEATGVLAAVSNNLQVQQSRFLVSDHSSIDNVFPSVDVDKAGNVYGVWSTERDGEYRIFMAWSTDRGFNWNGPVEVSSGTGTHVFPWVAANEAGKVAVAWIGSDETANPQEVTGAWQVRVAQSSNVLGGNPTFTRAHATGTMHEGGICIDGLSCDLGSGVDRDLGDYIQLDVGPDGRIHVAYTDDMSGDARIYHVKQTSGPLT